MSEQPSAPPIPPTSPTSPKDPLSGRLQQLGEELQCPLCIDYFEDPVALPCQHSFCRGCIRGAVRPRRGEANKQQVECPLCREKIQMVGSADSCVQKLPRNFHLAGIIEKFRAAEREKQRAEEELQQRQVLEQIKQSRRETEPQSEEQENRQQQQKPQENRNQQQQQPWRNFSMQQPTPSDFIQTTSSNENDSSLDPATPAGITKCKKCPYPGVIHCVECGDEYCLECQQTHSHGHEESTTTAKEEFHSEEFVKTVSSVPTSCSQEDLPKVDREQQQRLQQLQQKQQHLQLQLDQQQALSDFTPTLDWQQQQSDRWEELREKQGARRQVSDDHLQRHQDDEVPQEPLSWPLSRQNQQAYFHQDLSQQQQPPTAVRYPYPGHQEPFSPSFSSTTSSSQLTCSHCKFPAATHCKQCSFYFCWECKGDLHDFKGDAYANHNIVELMHMASLSSPCSLGPEQDVQNYSFPSTFPLIKMTPALEIGTSMTEEKVVDVHKIPYTCDIKGMGPGKNITVFGVPNDTRFHINLMCHRNLNSGDIALHFNPRFTWPKMVVRNTRIGGKYGSEERGGPSFPFKAGQPFTVEISCLIDKFKVIVDGKPFITYAHRIKDLQSIKFCNVNGNVHISSVVGCN